MLMTDLKGMKVAAPSSRVWGGAFGTCSQTCRIETRITSEFEFECEQFKYGHMLTGKLSCSSHTVKRDASHAASLRWPQLLRTHRHACRC